MSLHTIQIPFRIGTLNTCQHSTFSNAHQAQPLVCMQALAQQPPADVMAPPQIKAQLLQVVLTLSPLAAVLPGAGGPSGEVARGRADALLAALEALPSPVVRPLVDTMGMSR